MTERQTGPTGSAAAGATVPETYLPPAGDPPRDVASSSPTDAGPRPEESHWSLVLREFRKRKLAVFAAWTILLLVSLAIFAPLLATDRPIASRGANRFEYAEGVRSVRLLAGQAIEAETDAERETFAGNAAAWLDRMSRAVSAEPAEELRRLRDEFRRSARDRLTPDEAGTLRRRLDALASDRVVFRSRWAFPALASLHAADLFFMTAAVVILGLLAARLASRRPWRRQTVRRAIWAAAVVPPVAALVWQFAVPHRVDRTPYKQGLMASDAAGAPKAPVMYESVVWPPVPYAPDELNLAGRFKRLGWSPNETAGEAASVWDAPHWLGTDRIGRDVLSRMLWGGRVSLSVGVVAVGIYVAIGIVVGAVAGYFHGVVDTIVSRLIEVVIVFPAFFLILTIVAFVGPSLMNIMIVIGLTGWTGVARLVRGEFLRLAGQEFVLAGRALGYSAPRLIFRHVLPNALAPVLVAATFGVAGAILTESALSFLGLGITIPTPSWGSILNEGREALVIAPWLIYIPGFTVFVTIMAYNLAGEALRDASDPRLRGGR